MVYQKIHYLSKEGIVREVHQHYLNQALALALSRKGFCAQSVGGRNYR